MDLSDNYLEGSVDFGTKLNEIVTLYGMNLTNNKFIGTFPCLDKNFAIQYIDIRQNKFSKIDSINCTYTKELNYFLASFNPLLTQNIGDITRNFENLSMIAFGVTNVYGQVPSDAIRFGGQYIAFYDTDITTRYTIDNDNNSTTNDTYDWTQAWVVIGITVAGKLPSFVNSMERQLKMELVPNHDFFTYVVIPMVCTVVALVGYLLFLSKFGYGKIVTLSKYLRPSCDMLNDEIRSSAINETPQVSTVSQTFHQVMFQVHKFLFVLLILFVPLVTVYYLGAHWASQGFECLRISVTYLGSHDPTLWDKIWINVAFGLTLIYSWICVIFSIDIIKNTSKMSNLSSKHGYAIRNQNIDGGGGGNCNDTHSHESMATSMIVEEDDIYFQQSCVFKCFEFISRFIVFIVFLILFLLFLILPIGLYNLYHSLPTHNNLPLIGTLENGANYQILSYFIENFTSLIISLQQWFLITPGVNILIILFPWHLNDNNMNNNESTPSKLFYYKNFTVQLLRNFTLIIVPLCCLFIFDDKCLQNWKILWPSCDPNYDNNYVLGAQNSNACQHVPSFEQPSGHQESVEVCFDICSTKYVFYPRCVRQIFQVLAPLYTIKATIGLIFPLLYHLQIQFEIRRKLWYTIDLIGYFCCKKKIVRCLFCCLTCGICGTCTCTKYKNYNHNSSYSNHNKTIGNISRHYKYGQNHIDPEEALLKSNESEKDADAKNNDNDVGVTNNNGIRRELEKDDTLSQQFEHKRSLDVECIAIISSLEILIVFGWAIPIMIPIYNVIMFGYGIVYFYWLNVKGDKIYVINDGKCVKIVGKWLIVSVVIQQFLILSFYSQTQPIGYTIAVFVNIAFIAGFLFKHAMSRK